MEIPTAHFAALGWICLMGAIGGIVHAIRSGAGLHFPHMIDHRFRPGILGDLVMGMAGGVSVFLLVPGELAINETPVSLSNLVKTFGFALVGGYGGPMVLDKALGATVAAMQDTIDKQSSHLQKQELQQHTDHQAMQLVDLQLSDTAQAVIPQDELIDAIRNASVVVQHQIRQITSTKRRQAWQKKWADGEGKGKSTGLTERTIPIFKALLDAPGGESSERRLSQLAYALKDQDKPDWRGALEYISRAIKLVKGDRQVPHHYYYTWALAAIHEPEFSNSQTVEGVKTVESRLKKSLEFLPLQAGFQKELQGPLGQVVIPWLTERNIDLSEFGVHL